MNKFTAAIGGLGLAFSALAFAADTAAPTTASTPTVAKKKLSLSDFRKECIAEGKTGKDLSGCVKEKRMETAKAAKK